MNKIFVVGLPRSGTTSLCRAMLDMGFRTAHTAYTQQSFLRAEVVADTPVYCDYPFLDEQFPHSRFILLHRNCDDWAASMRGLLTQLREKIVRQNRGYHPLLERSLRRVFNLCDWQQIPGDAALIQAYKRHRQEVKNYFASRRGHLLELELDDIDAPNQLANFVGCATPVAFKRLNSHGRVFEWSTVKHRLKVGSHERGEQGRRYFDFPLREN